MVGSLPPRWGIYLLSGLLAAAGVGVAGCDSRGAAAAVPPPTPEVSVAPVLVQPVRQWDAFSGRIAAVQIVEIRPRVSGTVERVAFTDGQEVQRGDLLFVIDPRPYRAALAGAQAQLERTRAAARLAQVQTRRAKTLIASRAMSSEEFDNRQAEDEQSRAEVRAATAAVASAKLNLEFTEVRAPITGRTSRTLLTPGNLAQADQSLLTTLLSQDPVQVYFEPDEQSYLRYREVERNAAGSDISTSTSTGAGTGNSTGTSPGSGSGPARTVRVGLANETGFPHQGRLDFLDNRVDSATGTIRARAVLPNADRRFTPGLYARVQLDGGETPEALLIDERAVLTDQDRQYVYVLGADDKAVRKDVQLGLSVGRLRVVRSGLARGDEVVIDGVQRIFFPGMAVRPVKMAIEPPAPTVATPATTAPSAAAPAIQTAGK